MGCFNRQTALFTHLPDVASEFMGQLSGIVAEYAAGLDRTKSIRVMAEQEKVVPYWVSPKKWKPGKFKDSMTIRGSKSVFPIF